MRSIFCCRCETIPKVFGLVEGLPHPHLFGHTTLLLLEPFSGHGLRVAALTFIGGLQYFESQ